MLLASYKDIRIKLTEAVLIYFLLLLWTSFCFLARFHKIALYKRLTILEEIHGTIPSW